MKKYNKQHITLDYRITTSFYSYGDKKKDKWAINHIKKYITSFLKEELDFIGFPDYHYQCPDWDCTQKCKIKLLKSIKDNNE